MATCGKWMSGGTPNTSDESYWGGNIPWISASSLKTSWIDDSERRVTDLGAQSGTRLVSADTIIFVVRGMSLTTEFRIGLTQREVAFGQDCKALRPAAGIDAALLFVAIKSRTPEILGLVDHAGHGTGRLATDLLSKVILGLPEVDFAANAAAEVRPLIAVGAARQAENRTLRELRDTLLPKLMSGEIHIRDAEKVVEGVT
jgi:type I restriction enzyme S subunit